MVVDEEWCFCCCPADNSYNSIWCFPLAVKTFSASSYLVSEFFDQSIAAGRSNCSDEHSSLSITNQSSVVPSTSPFTRSNPFAAKVSIPNVQGAHNKWTGFNCNNPSSYRCCCWSSQSSYCYHYYGGHQHRRRWLIINNNVIAIICTTSGCSTIHIMTHNINAAAISSQSIRHHPQY